MTSGCKHQWDKIGFQKEGSERTCRRCAITQVKRARKDGFHLVFLWVTK